MTGQIPDADCARRIRYAQTRWTEVWLALIMTGWGALLLYPDPVLVGAPYQAFARWVSEPAVGLVLLPVGAMRLVALWINGRRRETPLARLVGCQVGFLVWVAVTAGFAATVPPLNTALAVYPVLAAAELHSAWRCGSDIIAVDSLRLLARLRRREARDA